MDDTFDIALFIKNREILDKVYNATIGNTLAYARYLKDLEEQGVNVEVIDLALDSVDRLWRKRPVPLHISYIIKPVNQP